MIARFFVANENIKDQKVVITGQDAHHLINVLRKKVGDEIEILDSCANCFLAKIVALKNNSVTCELISKKSKKTELPLKVTLFQCLPKAKKMDYILEKCTELGVFQIVPVISERSVVKLDQAQAAKKVARWNEITRSAAEQAGRVILPKVQPVLKLEEALTTQQHDLKLIPWETENQTSLKFLLRQQKNLQKLAIFIGPEGGFSQKEIKCAQENSVIPVTLGPRILRTETAGLFTLAAISYEFEL